MKSIQNSAAVFFIIATAVLSAVSVLGVWDILADDVINKSFQTLGLLALVAVVVMVSGRFIGARSTEVVGVSDLPNPLFKTIRHITLTILIVAVSLLALLGVMAIWEVIQDMDVLFKSLGSLGILAFGAFVMVMTCLEREGKLQNQKQGGSQSVGVGILMLLVAGWIIMSMSSF